MKRDSFSQRRRYVPLCCELYVPVIGTGLTMLTLAAPLYAFSTSVILVLRQRLSR